MVEFYLSHIAHHVETIKIHPLFQLLSANIIKTAKNIFNRPPSGGFFYALDSMEDNNSDKGFINV